MSMLEQQTEAWLKDRRNHLGASDAPVIMEVSPWSTPLQLWEEKVGVRGSKVKTAAMQHGLDTEEEARKKFEEITDIYVIPQVVKHPTKKWMMASLDGMDIERNNIVEIKCPRNVVDHEIARAKEVPNKYYPQLQHQMFVCELDKAYYFSYRNKEGLVVEVKRDEDYLKKLLEKEELFWECVQSFTPPSAIEKDYVRMNDPGFNAYVERYLAADAMIGKYEKEREEIKEHLLLMAGGLNVKSSRLSITKVVRKGIVDYKAIPELESIDLEKYRKAPITSWRLTNAEVSHTRSKVQA